MKGHIDNFVELEADEVTWIFQAPQSTRQTGKKGGYGIGCGHWF